MLNFLKTGQERQKVRVEILLHPSANMTAIKTIFMKLIFAWQLLVNNFCTECDENQTNGIVADKKVTDRWMDTWTGGLT